MKLHTSVVIPIEDLTLTSISSLSLEVYSDCMKGLQYITTIPVVVTSSEVECSSSKSASVVHFEQYSEEDEDYFDDDI